MSVRFQAVVTFISPRNELATACRPPCSLRPPCAQTNTLGSATHASPAAHLSAVSTVRSYSTADQDRAAVVKPQAHICLRAQRARMERRGGHARGAPAVLVVLQTSIPDSGCPKPRAAKPRCQRTQAQALHPSHEVLVGPQVAAPHHPGQHQGDGHSHVEHRHGCSVEWRVGEHHYAMQCRLTWPGDVPPLHGPTDPCLKIIGRKLHTPVPIT